MSTSNPHTRILVANSLVDIPAAEWNALTDNNPTLQHAWLQGMVAAGCTNASTGWLPQFILLMREIEGREKLAGAIPLYMKSHSYGEYVFDWAWADAYQRAGLDYYPKLLCAVPFTPCQGTRIMAATSDDRACLLDALLTIANDSDVSSLHVLFATATEHAQLVARGLQTRHVVQFHWHNDRFIDFDDFLSRMNHDKRKKIRQQRRAIKDANITFMHKTGAAISDTDWDFFHDCYVRTYHAHRSTPYLNRAFFHYIGEHMADKVLLVIAMRDDTPIAVSMNLFNAQTLYGRYWGATEYVPNLHFETCYYQTLEFCIARGIHVFEGGAQGEHKLARGFKPVDCMSAHWIRDERFSHAIGDFLRREANGISRYVDELSEHQPFKAL